MDDRLDAGFEIMGAAGFELPNGFVNHGAMVCEALDALDRPDLIEGWARRFGRWGKPELRPVAPAGQPDLGAYYQLPEWLGFFEREIDLIGWPAVVETWVPQLMPALRVALFHGAIRTGHAVRAISEADTAPRRAELARALGYWAARFSPAAGPAALPAADDVAAALIAVAADGARRYVAEPDIFHLHGVTGAMAVDLLLPHIPEDAGRAAVGQVVAEHEWVYRGVEPAPVAPQPWDDEAVAVATARHDAHQVKLVEACRRGIKAGGDPVFAAAARTVTGLA